MSVMAQHTLIIEVPDYLKLHPEEIQGVLTGAIEYAEVVAHREIHQPFSVVEYHHERMLDEPEPEAQS